MNPLESEGTQRPRGQRQNILPKPNPAPPRGEQEWTVEYLGNLSANGLQAVADAHNAALTAAKKKNYAAWRLTVNETCRKQLAAEREHIGKLADRLKYATLKWNEAKEQLAAERENTDLWKRQSAFESKHREKYRQRSIELEQQLAAEREALKPLVKALTILECGASHPLDRELARAALAKVKIKKQKPKQKKKRLVNVMRNKRAPLMSNFASTQKGFGHSRGIK